MADYGNILPEPLKIMSSDIEPTKVLLFFKPRPVGITERHYDLRGLQLETRLALKGRGVEIVNEFDARLSIDVIDVIYPNMVGIPRYATYAEMDGEIVHVAIGQGVNACRMAVEAIGEDRNPALCTSLTVRNIWRIKILCAHKSPKIATNCGVILADEYPWYYNFVHRSQNAEEFAAQFAALNAVRV